MRVLRTHFNRHAKATVRREPDLKALLEQLDRLHREHRRLLGEIKRASAALKPPG